jgi:glycosyltransferase involved in cell wall biosynthesis
LNLGTSITVTNPSEKLFLEKNYKCKNSIHILTNGISLEKFNKISFEKIIHQKSIVVSYIGNIGHAQDLKTFVDAARLRPEVQFQIIGTGVLLSEVQNYSYSFNVKNVSFIGRLEWDNLINIYSKSDILFASLRPRYLTAVPSKLYEYLSTGKYVIFTGGGEARNFLNMFSNCKALEFGDANAISNTILEFAQSDNFRKLSFSNREIIRKFYIREKSTHEFVAQIIKELDSL